MSPAEKSGEAAPERARRPIAVELLLCLRPHQWTKNLLLFAALLFARHLLEPAYALKALAAFGMFCLLSGAVYVVNDLADRERDRLHPTKRHRPIASGKVSPGLAVGLAVLCVALSVPASFALDFWFGVVACTYLLLQLAYSLRLKDVVILDVLLVAAGFVLRAAAGAFAIEVFLSPWLIICTLLLALFLALSKRRAELILLSDEAATHRDSLAHYSPYLLDQMISVVTASTVMAYGLYTLWPTGSHTFREEPLYLTIPFVIYGVFRYLYLIHQEKVGGSPARVLLRDRPLQVTIVFWALTVALILYLL